MAVAHVLKYYWVDRELFYSLKYILLKSPRKRVYAYEDFFYGPLKLGTFHFNTLKIYRYILKNHYIFSSKSSINNDKNIYKEQVRNHKEVN